MIGRWFNDLTWGPEKIDAENDRIRTTRNVNTTEISAGWSTVNEPLRGRDRADPRRDPAARPDDPRRSLVAQLPTGTNMYFNYFYELVDCEPEDEVTKYYLPIIAIIVEETLRAGGSIVHHHGIGKDRAPVGRAGVRQRLLGC